MTENKSIPFVPLWGREDLARAFALVVRSAIQGNPTNLRALAQILEKSEDTIKIWARGSSLDKLPGSYTLLQMISSLDAWYRFRGLLEIDADGINGALDRAIVALECAKQVFATYPPPKECEDAHDKLRQIRRAAEDLDEAATNMRRSRHGAKVVDLERRA
jgi:hypothetical protein